MSPRGATWAIDLDHEAPSARELVSLEDDVARVMRQFVDAGRLEPALEHELEWLARVADAGAGAALSSALLELPLYRAAELAWLLRAATNPSVRRAVLQLLERTRTDEPTRALLAPRARIASAIVGPLDDGTAARESELLVRWLPHLRAALRGREVSDDAASGRGEIEELVAAMRATRDLLERASTTRAPLDRWRAILDGDPVPSCEPVGDDAPRSAMLRHAAELWPQRSRSHVPGATCISVSSLDGPIEIVTTDVIERSELMGCSVSATLPIDAEVVDERYPDAVIVEGAPTRTGSIACGGGGSVFLLQEIDGLWRVVSDVMSFDY